MIMSKD